MTREQLALDFIKLTAQIQNKALELMDEKYYDNVTDLLTEVLYSIAQKVPVRKAQLTVLYGIVDKDKTIMDLGDDQGIMIFGEEVINED